MAGQDGHVVVGVDAHKRTHTLVAVDQVGRKLGERTVGTTSEGHLQAVEWAARWPRVVFAVEDCRHLTRRLEGDLLRAGHRGARPSEAEGGGPPRAAAAGQVRPVGRVGRGARGAARARPAYRGARRPVP